MYATNLMLHIERCVLFSKIMLKLHIYLVIKYLEISLNQKNCSHCSQPRLLFLFFFMCMHRFLLGSCVLSTPRRRELRGRPLLLQTAAISTPLLRRIIRFLSEHSFVFRHCSCFYRPFKRAFLYLDLWFS